MTLATQLEVIPVGGRRRQKLVECSPWSCLRRLVIWMVVATIFTAGVVQFSRSAGRLLIGPIYDDVGYFADVLDRLRIFHYSGFWGWLREWYEQPPHSPASTVLATLSYATFGPYDWAPYAGNGLVVLVLLLAVDWLQRGSGIWQRLTLALFTLTVPLAQVAVSHFRPDVLAGITTAMGAMVMLRYPLSERDATRRWAAGCLFAAALLEKTTTCVYTIYMCGVVLAADAAVAHFAYYRPWRRVLHPRGWGTVLLPIVLLAGPYYVLAYDRVYEYVHGVIAGANRNLWRVTGTWSEMARYFIDGQGGSWLLGNYLWLFVAVLLVGTAYTLARHQRAATVRCAALAGVTFAAYLLPTLNPVKNGFMGVTFQSLLLFGTIIVLHGAFRLHGRAGRPISPPLVGVCAVVLVAVWIFHPQGRMGTPSTDWIAAQNRLERQILESIVNHSSTEAPLVYFTTVGFTSADLLRVRALLAGRNIQAYAHPLVRDLATHRQEMQKVDFVIASEAGNGIAFPYMPSSDVQEETLTLARSLQGLRQIADFPALHGKRYFVFAKVGK